MPFDPDLAALRFGYGLPAPDHAPSSVDAMLTALSDTDQAAADWPIATLDEVGLLVRDYVVARRRSGRSKADDEAAKQALRALTAPTTAASRAQILRALSSPDGFRERLAAFWADHFTTAPPEGPYRFLPFAFVDQAIRPHISGRFADLLTAATLHPAMLIYLDQNQSVGPTSRVGRKQKRGLNENLARELIELHTLGVGAGYSQDDVRQMAELLTGLTVTPEIAMAFEPDRVEPGPDTVLGQTYDGKGLDPIRAMLNDLALRPETAGHIARKLASHFVADNPDLDLIAALTSAYADTDGDLSAVYAALLAHPATWTPAAQKVRQPYEFVLAALRGLQIPTAEIARMADGSFRRMVLLPMSAMGQPLHRAPGPDGWAEEAEAWITPQGLAARITWAMEVPGRLVRPLPDPSVLARRCLGSRVTEPLLWAVSRAENIREGTGLVFASPEFNRR